MTWSEDRLHRWLARRAPAEELDAPSGHDAAVLARHPGRDVACCDQVIEGVHAALGTSGAALGKKAAHRALSDLAATGATPRALLVALRAPREADEAWLRAALAAVDRAGRRYGAGLAGGDLAAAPGPASLAVTALGHTERRVPPHRAAARAGDVVLLTGPVGGSGLGRHLRFVPRLDEGRWLAGLGARAMMDVSDGLAWDLHRLARAAGVGVVLEHVPVHRDARRAGARDGRAALDHALHDGEDHELLAFLPPAAARRALREAPDACPGLRAIGRAVEGAGLTLALPDEGRRRWSPREGGWRHGS